jgi:multiple sugar transport system permease protein
MSAHTPNTSHTETATDEHTNALKNRDTLAFWLLILPAVILFSIMMAWPLINMFRVSLLDWRGIVKESTFTGFSNYVRMVKSSHFHDALRNTIIHIGLAMPLTIFPAFMLGYFLSKRRPGYRVLRTLFFTPSMLSTPALAMVFLGVYLPDGIINYSLQLIGLDNLTRIWLSNPNTSLGAIIAVDLWGGIGFYSVLFFTAISTIPQALFDAARIDGATDWTIMWRVVYPMTLDFVGVCMILHFTYLLLGSAGVVLLLTRGGPGTSSLTLGYYLYEQAFKVRMIGYSQAIGVFIFLIGLIGMIVIRNRTNRSYQ